MKRFGGILVVIAVIVGGIWFFVDGLDTEDTIDIENGDAIAVRISHPQIRTLVESLEYHGTVQALAQVPVVPKASGTVNEVPAGVGDVVERNTVLTVLEADEVYLQTRQADAAVKMAEANLARARSGARPEEIEQAQAALEQAEGNYESARSQYERNQRLYEEGVLSISEWEGVENQYQVARAQKRSAEQSLELALQGSHPDDIRAAEAAVEEAGTARELAQLAFDHTRIKAPRAGVVSQLDVDAGMTVGAGEPIGSIVDTSIFRMQVLMGGRDVAKVERGQAVSLHVDQVSHDPIEGEVVSVAPAADQRTTMFPVRLEFPNDNFSIRPGMNGQARIEVRRLEDVLSIPYRAVLDAQGQPYVYVVRDAQAEQSTVELGLRDGTYVEIADGLDASDQVVMAGQSMLSPGVPVEVVEDDEEVQQ